MWLSRLPMFVNGLLYIWESVFTFFTSFPTNAGITLGVTELPLCVALGLETSGEQRSMPGPQSVCVCLSLGQARVQKSRWVAWKLAKGIFTKVRAGRRAITGQTEKPFMHSFNKNLSIYYVPGMNLTMWIPCKIMAQSPSNLQFSSGHVYHLLSFITASHTDFHEST